MEKTINSAIYVAIITLIGGIAAAVVTSIYQDEVSKRELGLRTISLLAQDLLIEKPIILGKSQNPEQLNSVLRHKEMAFLAKGLTQHLDDNYSGMDFNTLRATLSSVERRYSYAQLYQAANAAEIICENIVFDLNSRVLQISERLTKCKSSGLDNALLSVTKIDLDNFRFELEVTNDKNGLFCKGVDDFCSFWIDAGDRLESTAYEYLVLSEYIGYKNVYKKEIPLVSFSIIKRITPVIELPKTIVKKVDNSYWNDNRRHLEAIRDSKNSNEATKCKPFFDDDSKTKFAPPAPQLTAFGKGVLRACGPIRGQVNEREFDALLKDNWLLLKETIPNEWASLSDNDLVEKLRQTWLTHNGFNHIYCGEWNGGAIQGLHFTGRYLQLQQEKKICYSESKDEEIAPDKVYTIGVRSTDYANRHDKKGYALKQSAIDLFVLGNKVFEYCNSQGVWAPYKSTFDNALYVKNSKLEIHYKAICKATDPKNKLTYGLLTLYPDLTPDMSPAFSF